MFSMLKPRTNLERLRHFDCLTIRELADEIGVDRNNSQGRTPHLETLLNGRNKIQPRLAKRISLAFNVSENWLKNNDLTAPMVDRKGNEITTREALQPVRENPLPYLETDEGFERFDNLRSIGLKLPAEQQKAWLDRLEAEALDLLTYVKIG